MVLLRDILPMWIAVSLGGVTAGLLALLVGYPCLRVRGPYFVILTFGLAELVKFIVVNVEARLSRFGRLLFAAPGIDQLYYVMAALAGVSMLLVYLVRRSRFGAGLRAIRENEEAAETLGVSVARFKILAFALSAVVPGMVGAIVVLRTTYFEPLQVFNPIVSFTIVSTAIVGGSDDAPGPLYGASFLVILSELLWANAPQVYMILLGLLLIGFVLWAPEGIHGRVQALRARISR
jgi:branched-chain amino acid transport system permease protein